MGRSRDKNEQLDCRTHKNLLSKGKGNKRSERITRKKLVESLLASLPNEHNY